MFTLIRNALMSLLLFTLLTGIIYPLVECEQQQGHEMEL